MGAMVGFPPPSGSASVLLFPLTYLRGRLNHKTCLSSLYLDQDPILAVSYLCADNSTFYSLQRRQSGLKSGGVVDPGQKISLFTGKFPKNFDFFRQFHKSRFFQANFRKISIFSGNFITNLDFPGKKLDIYSYFWENYSISRQKSPLSKILPVHDKI